MKRLAPALLTLLLAGLPLSAVAQVRLSIGLPSVHINLGVRAYPVLEAVPGYPVYYAPNLRSNYFFYDGLYWVYESDDWYASTWYDGPWDRVDRYEVPVFVLRIPVRYYRNPPAHFRRWKSEAPPRWSERWGRDWQQRRAGWDRWNHRSPARPPRPDYQRRYSGDHYPSAAQRRQIEERNYHYQSRDAVVLRHREQQRNGRARSEVRDARPSSRRSDDRNEHRSERRDESSRSEDRQGRGNGKQHKRDDNGH